MAENRDYDAATLEAARRLFAGPCTFVAGAHDTSQLPPSTLPEVAFAGRSNVGKSSLINALTGRKALARISATPGRTQQINFFDLGGRLMLVDLPGYGYARASQARIRAWTRLIELFLQGRPALKRVMLLIDCRRGIGDSDERIMDMMDSAAVSYQIVLTKCDRLGAEALAACLKGTAAAIARRAAAHPDILATSARDGAGIAELRAVLAALAAPEPSR